MDRMRNSKDNEIVESKASTSQGNNHFARDLPPGSVFNARGKVDKCLKYVWVPWRYLAALVYSIKIEEIERQNSWR